MGSNGLGNLMEVVQAVPGYPQLSDQYGTGNILPAVFPYVEKEEEVFQNRVPSGPKDLTRKVVVSVYAKPAEQLNIMEIKTSKNRVCLSLSQTLAPVFDTRYRPFEDGAKRRNLPWPYPSHHRS